MKKRTISVLVFLLFFLLQQSAEAQSTSSSNMLGIRISSKDAAINNSVTYKRFFNSNVAVEGLLSFGDPVALGVLLEKYKPFNAGSTSGLTWFYGAGAYIGFSGGRNFGAQGIVGLDFIFPNLPVNLSLDWKPELNFTKQFSFEPSAVGFSARFVF